MTVRVPTTLDMRITNFVLPPFSILTTIFRLWRREHASHIWWDDAWAGLTAVIMIIWLPTFELMFRDSTYYSDHTKVTLYYLASECYIAAVWASRISILFTVIRISVGTMRRVLNWIAIVFMVVWIALTVQVIWTCQARNKWSLDHSMCVLPTRIAIIQLTNVVGDAIVILAPIRLVWRTTLSKPQKIRIIAIFSTTVIMTVVSLNHAFTVLLNGGGLTEALASLLQSSISAIVCNLNVIITFIFHIATEDPNLSPPSKPMSSLRFGFIAPKSKTTGGGARVDRTEAITLEGLTSQQSDTDAGFIQKKSFMAEESDSLVAEKKPASAVLERELVSTV